MCLGSFSRLLPPSDSVGVCCGVAASCSACFRFHVVAVPTVALPPIWLDQPFVVFVIGSFSRFCCLPLIQWEFVIGFLVAPVLDRRLGFFLFSVLVQLQRLVSACSADCALIQRRCDCLVQAVLAFVSACSADASCCVCVAQVQCQCRLVQPTAR